MWSRAPISILLAAGVAFGCASHDDENPSGAAGQASAAAGSSNAGATNDGGRMNAAGAAAGGVATGGAATGGASPAGGSSGASTSCPAPLTVGDHSHLNAMELVGTYSVSGMTAQELRQSINTNRGHDYDALTNWNISWSYQNCASPVWSVSLNIVYDPKWDAPASADAALVASWQHYIDALYCHEYGHGELGLDCANTVYDALAALQSTGDCDALSAVATSTFQGLLAQCQARELEYDAETMHGATMGAVFPPSN